MFRLNKRLTAYLFLLINTVIWSVAFVVVKPAYEVTTPFRYLLYRFLLAGILMVPVILYYWPKVKPSWAQLHRWFWLETLGTVFALGILYQGLQLTTSIEANLLTTVQPLFVMVSCLVILKEKEDGHEWLGFALSLLGTLGLVFLPVLHSPTLVGISVAGNLLILGYNLANAFYFPYCKRWYHRVPKLFVAGLSFWVGALGFLLLSLWELDGSIIALIDQARIDLSSPSVWLASGYMAVFGSIIALTAYIKGQDQIEASEAILFTYLSPVFAIPAGMYFLGEQFDWRQGIFLLIIILGVIIAERRTSTPKKNLSRLSHTKRTRSRGRVSRKTAHK